MSEEEFCLSDKIEKTILKEIMRNPVGDDNTEFTLRKYFNDTLQSLVFEILEIEKEFIKRLKEEVIDELKDIRDDSNSLLAIGFKQDYSTNSVKMLKEILHKEINKIAGDKLTENGGKA